MPNTPRLPCFSAPIICPSVGLLMITLPYDGKVGPEVLAGLFGRFLLISYFGWLSTVDAYAIRLRKQSTAT